MFALRQFFSRSAGQTLFHTMVEKLGMREALHSRPNSASVLRRADTRCSNCGEKKACSGWLAAHEHADETPGYCSNHDLFERLKHEIESEAAVAG
jgi:hypothetical protein